VEQVGHLGRLWKVIFINSITPIALWCSFLSVKTGRLSIPLIKYIINFSSYYWFFSEGHIYNLAYKTPGAKLFHPLGRIDIDLHKQFS
jgi:hypothetical protein